MSFALDTNGQNARYVHAADRWGSDASVLKALALGNQDPAGVVTRYQVAADKLGGLKIRSAHRNTAYFDFPTDIVWTRATERAIGLLAREADVVHLNNSYRAARYFRIRKPMLLHHHGSLFRNNTKVMLNAARSMRMVQAVSTIDLTRADPETLHWLPTAYDVSELAKFGKAHRREPNGRVRIVHAPTNRAFKATEALESAVRELQAEGLPVDLVLIEKRTWAECMEIKATADIVFDQLAFGYGCNAVEAWGMGIPVISGADDWTLDAMRKAWGGLPFYEATEGTLTERIREMVQSADLRAEWAGRGMDHVRKYHDEKPALAKLAELYMLAIRTYPSGRAIPGKPSEAVTFTSKTGRSVYLEGERVDFVNGEAKVADPYMVSRLRYFVTKRPQFGIREVVEA